MSHRLRAGLYVCLLLGLGVGSGLVLRYRTPTRSVSSAPSAAQLTRLTAELRALEARENDTAQRVWGPELLAQSCGAVGDACWDALNAANDRWEELRRLALPEVILPVFGPAVPLGHRIEYFEPHGSPVPLNASGWAEALTGLQADGWRLAQFELRHVQFDTNNLGRPGVSVFHLRVDADQPKSETRVTLAGDIQVRWSDESTPEGYPRIGRVDASQLRRVQQSGPPPFQQTLFEEIQPARQSHFIDPLILYDLDGDGLSEIILAARNLVYHRQPDGTFHARPLCVHPPGLVLTAGLADFDGDGAADLLCAEFSGLRLFRGTRAGTFQKPGQQVWTAVPHLKYAQVLTCGDIDGDGDLDVWLGQYKNPYERGQMPTPYYGANDGYPSYLLLNDGHGRFTDATEAAGLDSRRARRCYSASWVDLDGDDQLDLLVVSDFAGVDVHRNDGQGHFTDMTRVWLPERHLFGMAHTFSDFDLDGRLDFLVMGMHCPTAQRLDHLGLRREDRPDYDLMRPRMAAGNRLFLGKAEGGYRAAPLGESIRHSGWSWGCAAFDWDNDEYPDVAIANGHETRQSVKDYEPEFWLHDIYVGTSAEDPVQSAYFGAKFGRTRGRGHSYGGYEKNRLFLNRQGNSFLDVGYPVGLAIEADSRNLMTDDLDGDGRVDLILTTFEVWPRPRQTLRVYRNTLEPTGNWIGFRLREKGDGFSPVGTSLVLRYADKSVKRQLVTGDSHRSQRANTVHFGLGTNTAVESIEVRWPQGTTLRAPHPAINQYHILSPRAR